MAKGARLHSLIPETKVLFIMTSIFYVNKGNSQSFGSPMVFKSHRQTNQMFNITPGSNILILKNSNFPFLPYETLHFSLLLLVIWLFFLQFYYFWKIGIDFMAHICPHFASYFWITLSKLSITVCNWWDICFKLNLCFMTALQVSLGLW